MLCPSDANMNAVTSYSEVAAAIADGTDDCKCGNKDNDVHSPVTVALLSRGFKNDGVASISCDNCTLVLMASIQQAVTLLGAGVQGTRLAYMVCIYIFVTREIKHTI